MIIFPANSDHLDQWAALRIALWNWDTVADHRNQAEELYLGDDPDRAAFVAVNAKGNVIAFAECTIRRDYVEGCNSSGVAFLEGIYVHPHARKIGVARALSNAVAEWGKAQGCTEYASNALIDNTDSHNFHAAIGFVETERVVFSERTYDDRNRRKWLGALCHAPYRCTACEGVGHYDQPDTGVVVPKALARRI